MTLTKNHLTYGVLALALTVLLTLSYFTSNKVKASAPTGLPATIATSSNPAVSTTAVTIIATSTCSARVISTASTSLMLTFSDYANQTPTAIFGVYQAASTTVVYDSGQYGCGLVKAYANAAGVITVIDSR